MNAVPRATPASTPFGKLLRLLLVPGLVLALGLFATYGLWSSAREESRRTLEDELQFWTDKVAYGIEDRLNGYVQVLRGVVGLFEASISVDRQEFQRYILALGLEERHPGAQGVGFSALIPADQKARHIAAVRAEGFPDYDIRPEGDRAFYTAVVYVEPFAGPNLRAFGYDMAPEPVRWAAAERARDQGGAALSGR